MTLSPPGLQGLWQLYWAHPHTSTGSSAQMVLHPQGLFGSVWGSFGCCTWGGGGYLTPYNAQAPAAALQSPQCHRVGVEAEKPCSPPFLSASS